MRNNEICTRHKSPGTVPNEKDFKLTLVCMHKNCADKFKLCCLKCRSEFHKDHAIKMFGWVELIKE